MCVRACACVPGAVRLWGRARQAWSPEPFPARAGPACVGPAAVPGSLSGLRARPPQGLSLLASLGAGEESLGTGVKQEDWTAHL